MNCILPTMREQLRLWTSKGAKTAHDSSNHCSSRGCLESLSSASKHQACVLVLSQRPGFQSSTRGPPFRPTKLLIALHQDAERVIPQGADEYILSGCQQRTGLVLRYKALGGLWF